jgi:hypothetical protein
MNAEDLHEPEFRAQWREQLSDTFDLLLAFDRAELTPCTLVLLRVLLSVSTASSTHSASTK